MTAQDVTEGQWWELDATVPLWQCPECRQAAPPAEWEACIVGCEDCGEHDGRECPNCGETYDHVWGINRIEPLDPYEDKKE